MNTPTSEPAPEPGGAAVPAFARPASLRNCSRCKFQIVQFLLPAAPRNILVRHGCTHPSLAQPGRGFHEIPVAEIGDAQPTWVSCPLRAEDPEEILARIEADAGNILRSWQQSGRRPANG
jgi:hypothetical protein